MKISILTPTFNRAKELERLYSSLVVNTNSNVKFEWLIMDDGSTDKTKLYVDNYIKQNIIEIGYYSQENQGKMAAINNLMKYVTGDICLTCDSDDYFEVGAFDTIAKYADRLLNDDTVYALAFLKRTGKKKISGEKFPENLHRTDMFSLYFREKMTGEKILVFKTSIRKKFKHELEVGEKFVTEDRMYHKLDLEFDIIGINEVLEIGDYQDDGYTKNIDKIFKENPQGFYLYFKEILEMDLKGVPISKKMYIYKHYILFANLADAENPISNAYGFLNKIIITFLWIPGKIKTRKRFGSKKLEQIEKIEERK